MAKYAWPAGSTSKTVLLFIQDSASTTGAGKTGLTVGAIATQQIRVQTNNTVTIATVSTTNLTALTDAYASGGWFEIAAATAPGWYRFDIPNEALSTGAVTAAISIIGSVSASNVAQLALEIQLQNVPADVGAWSGASVTTGNIALWQTISAANVTHWNGTAVTTPPAVNVTSWAGASVTNNNIVFRSTSATLLADVLAWDGTAVASARPLVDVRVWAATSTSASNIALTDFSTRLNANVQQWSGKSVSTSDLAAFSVSQTVLTAAAVGSVNVLTWAGVTVSASNIAITDFSTRLNVNVQQWSGKSVSTSDLAAFSVSQTVLTSATVAGQVDVGSWGGVTVSASNVAIRNPGTLADVILTRSMAESYGTISAQFTPAQAFYRVWSMLSAFSISGAALTTLQLDQTTTAMAFSLDSSTAPTKILRIT